MKKQCIVVLFITLLASIILSSCGGGGGDDSVDNSHMFGIFEGSVTWYYSSNPQSLKSNDVVFKIGDDQGSIDDTFYVYMPLDADFFEYSSAIVDNDSDEIILYYTASSTDDTITYERSYTVSGVMYRKEHGTIKFNNDFASAEASGSIIDNIESLEMHFDINDISHYVEDIK